MDITVPELIEEFDFLGNWEDQCRYLIELGEELPDLPPGMMTERNRVQGCQSRVWMVADVHRNGGEPRLSIKAKSDAKIVDGLIVVLLALSDEKTPREVLAADFRGTFKRLGLDSHLVPQRRNGLYAMVERIRTLARKEAENGLGDGVPAPGTQHLSPPELKVCETADPMHGTRLFKVDEVRHDFPGMRQRMESGRDIIYLDSASSAQKPQVVIDKEREVYENYYANAYRGVYQFGRRVSDALDEVRIKIQRLIGAAEPEEVIYTSGTTLSINLVAQAWGRKFLNTGDEIVVSELEHHANLVPWQRVASQTGAVLKFLPLTADGRIDMHRVDEALGPRARMVAITGMSNVLGTVPPIVELSRKAKAVGALLLVDGAQSVPHLPMHVINEGIDFLAFSGHKLYGPSGVGVLYGRRELLEAMDPFLCGGHMIERVEKESSTWARIPAKFEAGTPPIAQAIALGSAIDYVLEMGLCPIHTHEQSVLRYAHEQLAGVPGLKIYGPPPSEKGAIVSFTIDGTSAEDLAQLLGIRGVFVRHGHHCTMPLHELLGVPATVRASFGMYNTRGDVDALVESLHWALTELKRPAR
jgi:cysteine desulfurase/selenocysteine lyase